MTKHLQITKPSKCACCGEMMQVGEAFRWHKGRKSVPDFSRRSMGTVKDIDTFRPAHIHDCYGAKVKAQLDQLALEKIDNACAMALQYGESEEWVSEYREKLVREAGL